MTAKQKKLLLDVIGAFITVALPAAAAISEFPKIAAATTGGSQFLTFLNVSSTAFAVICVIAAATAWRFFHHRLRMPRSGFFPLLILYAIVHGINMIIDPFEIIVYWAAIGSGIAFVLAFIADKKYGGEQQ